MPVSASSIDDFNSWTQVQDPPHTGMTGSIDNLTQATLTAIGPVPAGTDIGYQSVNGNNVASSSYGSYFSASQDFHIAVDFALTSLSPTGFAAIGFGVGEDSAGTNSAGALLAILNGGAPVFSGGARINDISQTQVLPVPGLTTSGRFFVHYDSLSGDISYGVNATPGSAAPSYSGTFSGLQHSWNGDHLLASFFLRSDDPAFFSALTSGTVSAVFSNFEVLEGTPVSIVPLPAAVWLFGFGLAGLIGIARRKARSGI
ncbi:MAG: VPLPA-CTERM sorting domain-containing protein [Gammaproteobacteria bacterium]|nr:VPLPA-CTERM sorting domain-containing protein [Gammaproteobacteria bacterium]